jgi:hypothetical protein
VRFYGACDLAFAALYLWVGFALAPSRSLAFNVALASLSGLLALAGSGLLLRARWGRMLAIIASVALLAFALLIIVLLILASAYFRGIYGALGQGIAAVSLCVAALVLEGFAILPICQLRFLLRDGSRR